MNTIIRIARFSLIAAAAMTGVLGCSTAKTPVSVSFRPDDEKRAYNHFAEAQSANGARQDATLQPAHFNGTALNTLGTAKLDEIIKGDGPTAVVVYLNFLPDDSLTHRKDAVTTYLTSHGLAAADVKVETGLNPATFTPAAPILSRVPKTESGGAEGGSSTGGASAGAASGTAN